MIGFLIAAIIVAGIIIALLVSRRERKHKQESRRDAVLQSQIDTAPHELRHPNGCRVMSPTQLSDAVLIGISRGFERAQAEARRIGWTNNTDAAGYTVVVVDTKGVRDSLGVPCFKVRLDSLDPYFNSEWDKERGNPDASAHYLLAAEKVLTDTDNAALAYRAFLIANSNDAAYIEETVNNGLEHCFAKWNDQSVFQQYLVHGGGQGHPFLPLVAARGEN